MAPHIQGDISEFKARDEPLPLKSISTDYRRVSAADELRLIEAWQTRRDQAAIEKLLEMHRGFLLRKIKRYANWYGAIDHDDLFQSARIGFYKSVERYRPDVGAKLIHFADFEIKKECRAFITQSITVQNRIRGADKEILDRYRQLIAEHHRLYGEVLPDKKQEKSMAEKLGCSMQAAREIRSFYYNYALFIDQDSAQGGRKPVGHLNASLDSNVNAAETLGMEEGALLSSFLTRLISKSRLTDYQREILRQRFFGNGGEGRSLKEVAAVHNVGPDAIRKIEIGTLEKIRAYARGLKDAADLFAEIQEDQSPAYRCTAVRKLRERILEETLRNRTSFVVTAKGERIGAFVSVAVADRIRQAHPDFIMHEEPSYCLRDKFRQVAHRAGQGPAVFYFKSYNSRVGAYIPQQALPALAELGR